MRYHVFGYCLPNRRDPDVTSNAWSLKGAYKAAEKLSQEGPYQKAVVIAGEGFHEKVVALFENGQLSYQEGGAPAPARPKKRKPHESPDCNCGPCRAWANL